MIYCDSDHCLSLSSSSSLFLLYNVIGMVVVIVIIMVMFVIVTVTIILIAIIIVVVILLSMSSLDHFTGALERLGPGSTTSMLGVMAVEDICSGNWMSQLGSDMSLAWLQAPKNWWLMEYQPVIRSRTLWIFCMYIHVYTSTWTGQENFGGFQWYRLQVDLNSTFGKQTWLDGFSSSRLGFPILWSPGYN